VSHLAQRERRSLSDLLLRVGPDAPTLCEGWTTADLAAHLVLRERRPDAAIGIVVPFLAGHTQDVQKKVRDGRSYEALVAAVRGGPPFPLRFSFIDEPMNTSEFFIHHEDVRRAQEGWEPRELDPEVERALWSRVRFMARMAKKASPVGLTLVSPGYGRVEVRSGQPAVTVTAPPGELLLFLSGRQQVASVDLAGDADAVERVRRAKFGL
jgi:uncharacterized protein (TIGR03085 family)